MRAHLTLLVVALVFGCEAAPPVAIDAGGGDDASAHDAAPASDAGSAPITWEPCSRLTEGTTMDVECASLDVPLDPAQPGGRTIPYFVKRIRAAAPRRGVLVLLNGGLVSSGVDLEPSIDFFMAKAPGFDLLIPDHRGTGRSSRLGCTDAELETSPGGFSVLPEEAEACEAALRAEWGDDLDRFGTTEAAHDVLVLIERAREEGDAVFVFGVSYGSLLAQRILRIAPVGTIDGTILDGTCNPGVCTMSQIDRWMDDLSRRFFAECARDAFCSARLGADPIATVSSTLDMLDAGHCPEVVAAGLDRTTARALMASVLGYAGWTLRPSVAAMIYRLGRCEPRDVAALRVLVRVLAGEPPTLPAGVRYASDPAGFRVGFTELWEEPAPTVAELVAFDEAAIASASVSVRLGRTREHWTVTAPDEHAHRLADTTAPMLILHGGLDFIPDVSADVARAHYTAPHQTYVTIPRAPHSTLFAPTTAMRGCAGALIEQFVADPEADIDTTCTTQIAPIDFTAIGSYGVSLFGTSDIWDG